MYICCYQYQSVFQNRSDTILLQISDPYRWLEDPDSEETKGFVEEQNKLTKQHLEKYTNSEVVNKAWV